VGGHRMGMVESVRYRQGWRTAVVVLAVVGVLTAFVFIGLSTIVVAFLMGGIMVGSVHLSVGLAQEREIPALIREVLMWAGRAGLVMVAICGYAAAVGLATLPLLLLIAATSPPVIGWLYASRADGAARTSAVSRVEVAPAEAKPARAPRVKTTMRRRSKPKAQQPATPEPAAVQPTAAINLTELSDEELCLAWRRSYIELQSCTTEQRRLEVVARRNAYLDELERRAPDAFAEWLESGPRAAGDPAKFFNHRTDHGC
jgi:hypothetical protein